MTKLFVAMVAMASIFLMQPVKAERTAQAGPTMVTVPDGGSTMALLSLALLGMAALRPKLNS